jgi:hypothetical protein
LIAPSLINQPSLKLLLPRVNEKLPAQSLGGIADKSDEVAARLSESATRSVAAMVTAKEKHDAQDLLL